MEKTNKQLNTQSPEEVKLIALPKSGKGKASVNWEKVKIEYFLSPYKEVRRFLLEEKKFSEGKASSGEAVQKTTGWSVEKVDWEKQALEITLHNLRDSKVVEMSAFLKEENVIIKQLLNMTKVAMNNLIVKGQLKGLKGKAILELKNTQGFKQVTDSALEILKYARGRLDIPFGEEDKGLKNAVNFNFYYVNLDEFDPEKLATLFTKQNARPTDNQSNQADDTSAIPEVAQS